MRGVLDAAFDEVVVGSMGREERVAYLSGLKEVGNPKWRLLERKLMYTGGVDGLGEQREIEAAASKER